MSKRPISYGDAGAAIAVVVVGVAGLAAAAPTELGEVVVALATFAIAAIALVWMMRRWHLARRGIEWSAWNAPVPARVVQVVINAIILAWIIAIVAVATVVVRPISSLGGPIVGAWMGGALLAGYFCRRRIQADTLLPYGVAFLVALVGAAVTVIATK